ncbi:transposase [Cyanobium sp. NIES-981]|uniref:IS91 family transposase n=1 Tax=Cyanobium sp. NIES-981 TaxID=1851505 RepID=UPI0007DD803A|nr:transposase [Cyanobium sp. NIES-981]SBO42012.1 transposase [Cyanobium sp. NIES-981]
MILLSQLVERYQVELERRRGHQLLPSHRQALQALRRCRRQGSDLMVLQCGACEHSLKIPHSCGHRSCPHCQHQESQRWIERQQAKLLPVEYFLITFTVPAELRALFWRHQRQAYDLLLKTAWQTLASFARRDPKLRGQIGAHAVLHTHNRRLDYHPHVHLIVPAGALHARRRQWRSKPKGYLFPAANLARVFRAKWFEGMRLLGLQAQGSLPHEWVVHCKPVGGGSKALVYLGRYLYRAVLSEKNILADQAGKVTFRTEDNTGQEVIQTLSGADFLWLLLRHVLPKRFRRVRDYGLLHGNARQRIKLLQLLLRVVQPEPAVQRRKPPLLCPQCGAVMNVLAVRVQTMTPLLC